MKKIDPKSVIIGILGTLLIFATMGATNDSKNLGDIVVNSVTVVDEKGQEVGSLKSFLNSGLLSLSQAGKKPMVLIMCEIEGGTLRTFNTDFKEIVALTVGKDNGGHLKTYNAEGKQTGYFGTNAVGGGHLKTYNAEGKETVALGTGKGGGGVLKTYNRHGKEVGYFGTNKDNDGMILLYDRYGDPGWGKTGKK